MPRSLLDTDILSEVMRAKNETVRARAMQYLAAEGRVTVSAVTVMEVVKGLHRVAREAELLRFLGSAAGMEIIPVGRDEAVEAGRIYGDLERTGQVIGRADPMIAATALVHGLVLVTGNEDHYRRVQSLRPSLVMDNWRRDAGWPCEGAYGFHRKRLERVAGAAGRY